MSTRIRVRAVYRAARMILWAFAVELVLSAAVLAAGVPGAGNILQQTQPPKLPSPSKTQTGLRLAGPKRGTSASKVRFAVNHIRITGSTLFPASTLHPLVAHEEGKILTLGALERLAGKITDFYHAHGYSLSRAVIPAQTVQAGVVRIEVIEARFGKIRLNNESRVRPELLDETLSPLHGGRIIDDRVLDRSLLLLSDIPGVKSSATLKPGTAVGTSELDVNAEAAPLVTGYIGADNYGNQYTGRLRVGAGMVVNDPLHLGDVLDLNLITAGRGLDYGRAAYDVVLNGSGTRAGLAYSTLHYRLGGALGNLGGYGAANVSSARLRQPVIRSVGMNLDAQAQYDHMQLRDHIDTPSFRTDRHLDDVVLSLVGDVRDHALGADAVTSWMVSWTSGHVVFDDATAAAADAATARTAGQFSKWNVALVRLQSIDARDALYLSASGQWANKNLDTVEKLVVGGPYGLRGYDVGVLSADTGYLLTLELRHRFTARVQAKVFADGEHVNESREPWSAGKNGYSLGDIGVGFDVEPRRDWHLGCYLAGPVGAIPAGLANGSSVRGWVQVTKVF